MISIYGSPKSSAGRCFWCLEESGVGYETQSINFKEKQHKSEAYLKVNPNGKVPALQDGDFTIWESMGINFYVAEAYKPQLLGSNAKEKGLVHQWSIWSIADLQPPLIEIFIQLVFVPEQRRSQQVIDKAQSKLPELLETLNMGLKDKTYLVGEEFTLADLNVHSVVTICDSIKFDLGSYENILHWKDQIEDRPAYQKYQELCR